MLTRLHTVPFPVRRRNPPGFGQRWLLALLLVLIDLGGRAATAADTIPAHGDFSRLLQRHVRWLPNGHASVVDYAGFARDRAGLQAYLKSLSAVSTETYAGWPQADQQAFLINAYNAATIELILGHYPALESIKDLGGLLSSPWQKPVLDLLGKTRSLDDIEHGLLRGAANYRDPRIHFAVNCASIGCPALRNEAYTGVQLEQQLEDQTQRFLADRSRNRFDADDRSLLLSPIFDWYGADFERLAGGLKPFLLRYAAALGLDARSRAALVSEGLGIRFGDYDWRLNRPQS
ncbi:MAG: DUF547 domain-containing protein [Lysobacterales bacterium]